jgi:hypothetical protein
VSDAIKAKLVAVPPKFEPGRIVMTPGAIEVLANNNALVSEYLVRHVTGDWGDMTPNDKACNEGALKDSRRLFSAYKLPNGDTIWIITDAVDHPDDGGDPLKRDVTTVLTPMEY